jgi:hypothetical protein
MARIDEHPTVIKVRSAASGRATPALTAADLKELCLACGADDAGIVSIGRAELDDQRAEIQSFAPWTKTLLAFVCRMNREPIRSSARSVANLEFHHTGDHVNDVARNVVTELEARGIKAVNPSMGFPMEMDNFPEQDLGRVAQAGRGCGGAGADGNSSKRDSSKVWQLYSAGDNFDW